MEIFEEAQKGKSVIQEEGSVFKAHGVWKEQELQDRSKGHTVQSQLNWKTDCQLCYQKLDEEPLREKIARAGFWVQECSPRFSTTSKRLIAR